MRELAGRLSVAMLTKLGHKDRGDRCCIGEEIIGIVSVGGIGGTRGGGDTMPVEGRVNKLGESFIRVANS